MEKLIGRGVLVEDNLTFYACLYTTDAGPFIRYCWAEDPDHAMEQGEDMADEGEKLAGVANVIA